MGKISFFQILGEVATASLKVPARKHEAISMSTVVCRENPFFLAREVEDDSRRVGRGLRPDCKTQLNSFDEVVLASTLAEALNADNSSTWALEKVKKWDAGFAYPWEGKLRLWFQHFLKAAVDPFLALATNHGILLGAHLQNILIGLEKMAQKVSILGIFRERG